MSPRVMAAETAARAADIDRQRGRVVQTAAAVAIVAVLALAGQLVPAGYPGLWLGLVLLVGASAAAAALLAQVGRVTAGAVLMVVGPAAAVLIPTALTRDLGVAPFWLIPVAAVGALTLPPRALTWLGLGLAVAIGALAVLGPPATFETPSYADLMVNGTLVSLATVVVAAYGTNNRRLTYVEATELALRADELLVEGRAERDRLRSQIEDREAALSEVVEEQKGMITALSDMAVRDPRTGLFNARHHKEQWSLAVEESRSAGLPLSVIALDLDHFGRINRDYSHEAGDRVLEEFAALIRRLVRPSDVPYRLGQGEEFVVLLPHTAGAEAVAVAERIRVACRKQVWSGIDAQERLTVSVGVTNRTPDSGELWSSVLARADEALLASKEAGRDRVTLREVAE